MPAPVFTWRDILIGALLTLCIYVPPGLIMLAVGCARDTQLCDGEALARKARVAVEQCQARGYDWRECPDRERILRELAEELGRCSK